jgi:hypothetical protein
MVLPSRSFKLYDRYNYELSEDAAAELKTILERLLSYGRGKRVLVRAYAGADERGEWSRALQEEARIPVHHAVATTTSYVPTYYQRHVSILPEMEVNARNIGNLRSYHLINTVLRPHEQVRTYILNSHAFRDESGQARPYPDIEISVGYY